MALRVVVVQGPTAVGKSAAALSLAAELPIEIINADSLQLYRQMDIGSAKPTPAEMAVVPHHLFSIIDPDADFDAARYMQLGRAVIEEVARRNHVPVVVGGTGLYVRALTRGLFDGPPADAALRAELKQRDAAALHAELQRVDPSTAANTDPHDQVRLVRALEVYHLTGEPLSVHHQRHRFADRPFDCLCIGLMRPRDELYARINRRVDAMLAAGFVDEVRALLQAGYDPALKPLRSIGYRQLIACLQGRMTLPEATDAIRKASRNLAKRQLTWLRNADDMVPLHLPQQQALLADVAKKFLNRR